MAYVAASGTVECQVEDGIAWVRLNRPETRNTIDSEMQRDLAALWPELNDDDGVRVIVLSGNGDCFSDGMVVEPDPRQSKGRTDWMATYMHRASPDLEEVGLGPALDTYGLIKVGVPDRTRGRPAKPLILAVHGNCSGFALEFVAFADFVICSEDAAFFDPRVNVGDVPAEGTASLIHLGVLRRLIALRLAYGGVNFRLDAARAFELGLAVDVTAPERLIDRARELANQILEASPAAVRAVVAAYWDTVSLPYGQARMIAGFHAQQARTIDGREGYQAWAEGRAPDWPSLTSWGLPWVPFRLKTTE